MCIYIYIHIHSLANKANTPRSVVVSPDIDGDVSLCLSVLLATTPKNPGQKIQTNIHPSQSVQVSG